MNRVLAIIKSQASYQFQQKKREVVLSAVNKNKNNCKNFQSVLDVYLHRN